MASTSSVQRRFKYDVFLSFRGEDIRKTFVDHLYHALVDKGFNTYKDDEKIEKGEKISEQLIRSIEDSRFHLIVFSKNYANSSWCLNELVTIMNCQMMTEQTAYAIFYDVEPTEVRNLSGAVEKAFAKHADNEDAGRWKDALREAAKLAGLELKTDVDGHEEFIQKIVQGISLHPFFISPSRRMSSYVPSSRTIISIMEEPSEGPEPWTSAQEEALVQAWVFVRQTSRNVNTLEFWDLVQKRFHVILGGERCRNNHEVMTKCLHLRQAMLFWRSVYDGVYKERVEEWNETDIWEMAQNLYQKTKGTSFNHLGSWEVAQGTKFIE